MKQLITHSQQPSLFSVLAVELLLMNMMTKIRYFFKQKTFIVSKSETSKKKSYFVLFSSRDGKEEQARCCLSIVPLLHSNNLRVGRLIPPE